MYRKINHVWLTQRFGHIRSSPLLRERFVDYYSMWTPPENHYCKGNVASIFISLLILNHWYKQSLNKYLSKKDAWSPSRSWQCWVWLYWSVHSLGKVLQLLNSNSAQINATLLDTYSGPASRCLSLWFHFWHLTQICMCMCKSGGAEVYHFNTSVREFSDLWQHFSSGISPA